MFTLVFIIIYYIKMPRRSIFAAIVLMISRHSARVKTMQAIYGYERSEFENFELYQKQLSGSISGVKNIYLYILLQIREIANITEAIRDIKYNKYLPTNEDINFNTKILSNTLIQYLNHDKEFLKAIDASKVSYNLDETITRKLYDILIDSRAYQKYIHSDKEFDFEEDKSIIQYIFESLVIGEPISMEYIEETFPTWDDDAFFVVSAVREVIKKSKSELKLHIEKETLQDKFKELTQFGHELYRLTITHRDEQLEIIKPYLQNWEADRLANVDMLLLRMALTELLYFSYIPYKVTLNEYIEISKTYCGPKSKDFINGLLDKISSHLMQEGKIKKSGRGLVNG